MFRSPSALLDKLPGNKKRELYKSALGRVLDSELGDRILNIVVKQEVALVERVARLESALDIDHIQEVPQIEERKETLRGVIEAMMEDDVAGWWFEEVVAPQIDNPDDAEELVGLTAQEWGETCDKWVRSYRMNGSDLSRSEIVADYVDRQFGVPVDVFVSQVVVWDDRTQQQRLQEVMTANFGAAEHGIDLALEEVEDAD